jgi:hypothetical protein
VINFEQRDLVFEVIADGQKGPFMDEQWNEVLRCPKCHRTGLANLSQPINSVIPAVDCLPDGFRAFSTEFGPLFECEACGVLVEP